MKIITLLLKSLNIFHFLWTLRIFLKKRSLVSEEKKEDLIYRYYMFQNCVNLIKLH